MSHEDVIRKFYASKINSAIGSSTDLSFIGEGSVPRSFLQFLTLRQLGDLKASLKGIHDEAESHFQEEDMRWKYAQSQKNGVASEIQKLIESRMIEKYWWSLSNEVNQIKKLIHERIKNETPAIFHQFISICDSTAEKLLGGSSITSLRVEQIKGSLDEYIESLKYSCLFDSLGPKLPIILNELKHGEIQASSLPMISKELYYLVCYEAASKYIEVISGGLTDLRMRSLDDYFITEVGHSSSGRIVTLDIVECSLDKMRLTLVESEDAKDRLNAVLTEKLSSLEKSLAEKAVKWARSQRSALVSPDGKYKGIKIEAIPGTFANHEELFKEEVLVHKESKRSANGDVVSKYSITGATERSWETNSIVIDLSRHIKGSSIEGLVPDKFSVRVVLYSRCAKFSSAI